MRLPGFNAEAALGEAQGAYSYASGRSARTSNVAAQGVDLLCVALNCGPVAACVAAALAVGNVPGAIACAAGLPNCIKCFS